MLSTKPHLWIFATTALLLILGASLYYTLVVTNFTSEAKKPHIIIILADDMGRNDVGFHGSDQIPTPNLDSLAYNGIVLDRYYTQSVCTPSRAALMTGMYPIRTGMQGYPLKAGENRSIPENIPTMPEQMKKLGYKTHLVGKWHLGAAYKKVTPVGRGFDTHFGYRNGFVGYFDYVTFRWSANGTKIKGLDIYDQFRPVWSAQGQYATDLFTNRSLEIIDKHDTEEPLFLVVSHLAPHTGKDGVELEVPNKTLTDEKFSYIKDPRRRLYADIVNRLDDSVGQVVHKLSQKNMLKNSIILFFSDNGAQTIGMYENSGSNWPLRGVKFAEFEGGIRTAATIFSPLFQKRSYVSKELIHITDWLPTFYAAAGGDVKNLGIIDGINQWDSLSKQLSTNRTEILVNINDVDDSRAIISDRGQYKYLKGSFHDGLYDKYYGENGRGVPFYHPAKILESATNKMIQRISKVRLTTDQILEMRSKTDLSWCRNMTDDNFINCTEGCLFDLEEDPCETRNILESKSEVAKRLYQRLQDYEKESVPQTNQPPDPNSDPIYYNNTWCTWLDDDLCFKTPNNRYPLRR